MPVTKESSQKSCNTAKPGRKTRPFGHKNWELWGIKKPPPARLEAAFSTNQMSSILFSSQFVAHPTDGLNDQRIGWVSLDLAAQAIDHVLKHRVIRLAV